MTPQEKQAARNARDRARTIANRIAKAKHAVDLRWSAFILQQPDLRKASMWRTDWREPSTFKRAPVAGRTKRNPQSTKVMFQSSSRSGHLFRF